MIVTQSGTFRSEFIDVWRLDNRIAGTAEVAVALVIGDDNHDIGRLIGSSNSLVSGEQTQDDESEGTAIQHSTGSGRMGAGRDSRLTNADIAAKAQFQRS